MVLLLITLFNNNNRYEKEARGMGASLGFCTMYVQPKAVKGDGNEKGESQYLSTDDKINLALVEGGGVGVEGNCDRVFRSLTARELTQLTAESLVDDSKYCGYVVLNGSNLDGLKMLRGMTKTIVCVINVNDVAGVLDCKQVGVDLIGTSICQEYVGRALASERSE